MFILFLFIRTLDTISDPANKFPKISFESTVCKIFDNKLFIIFLMEKDRKIESILSIWMLTMQTKYSVPHQILIFLVYLSVKATTTLSAQLGLHALNTHLCALTCLNNVVKRLSEIKMLHSKIYIVINHTIHGHDPRIIR